MESCKKGKGRLRKTKLQSLFDNDSIANSSVFAPSEDYHYDDEQEKGPMEEPLEESVDLGTKICLDAGF
jgi:hypothetical protein